MRPATAPVRGPSAAELVAGLAAAVVATLLVHLLVWGIDFFPLDSTAAGLGPIWAAVMVALALVGYAAQQRWPLGSRWVVAVLAGLAAGVVMAPLMAGLHGTPQPPFTVLRGDMTFRTEYVTRFASTWQLDDYTFRGLGAFYPPAWFWLAGRSAHVLGIEPWRIMKPFTIGTAGVALALAYVLWRRVLTPAGALAAAVGSSLVLTRQMGDLGAVAHAIQGWYSPYSCFVAVTGIAWLAATLMALRTAATRRGWAFLALVGALLALCYYLLFVVLVIALVALALARPGERRRSLGRTGALLGAVAVLTAVFWVPLVLSVLRGSAAQGHYLAPDFLDVSVGFNGPTELVLLAVVAVIALVLAFAWPAAQAVGVLLGATIGYQLLSVTTLVFSENQLQPHRAVTMMWATLGAAVPVALEGMSRSGTLGAQLPPAATRAVALVIAVIAIPATFVLGAAQGRDLSTGPLTVGAHDPVDMRTPYEIGRYITNATGRPATDLTVLTDDRGRGVLVTQPFHGFLPLGARYAHPEARLGRRVRAVRAMAACQTMACTTRALTVTGFGPVDAVVLTRTGTGVQLTAQLDHFPLPRFDVIAFRPALFDRNVWARRWFGDLLVLVRRPYGAVARAGSAPSGTRRHSPTPVSTRAGRPGRSPSSSRARSSRRARTPRSSCTRRDAALRRARSAAAGAVHHPAASIHAPCHSSHRQR